MESGAVEEEREGRERGEENNNITVRKKGNKLSSYFIPRFPCMRLDDEVPTAETPAAGGGFDMEASCNGRDYSPTHLVVTVNGIFGSAQDWRYAAKQFVKAYPHDILVHCSKSNASILTLNGVDVMGKRLADEVLSVVRRHPSLRKISFVGHSLGGLVARYAVALLYRPKHGQENEEGIAGLEPVNFITFATPHLGSRGHKQVPVFCGLYAMERLATRASVVLGRTGRHLFLRDCDGGEPPILLRMSSNSGDLKFISALQCFRRRVAYANVRFDSLVGWSSSSLRRRSELPKRRSHERNAKYPHIVNEEKPNGVTNEGEASLEIEVSRSRSKDMEEKMIRGLTRLEWERVDVSFKGSMQRILAHTSIQVTTQCINSQGADVVQHMIDNFIL